MHFGQGHRCLKHDKMFDVDHLSQCDQVSGCERVKDIVTHLKGRNIREWEVTEIAEAITTFTSIAL